MKKNQRLSISSSNDSVWGIKSFDEALYKIAQFWQSIVKYCYAKFNHSTQKSTILLQNEESWHRTFSSDFISQTLLLDEEIFVFAPFSR